MPVDIGMSAKNPVSAYFMTYGNYYLSNPCVNHFVNPDVREFKIVSLNMLRMPAEFALSPGGSTVEMLDRMNAAVTERHGI